MDHSFAVQHSYLIPLLPLIGAAVAGFFGARWLKGQSHWPIWIGVGASAVLSFMILFATLGAAGDHHGGADAGHVAVGDGHAAEGTHGAAPANRVAGGGPVAVVDWFNWIDVGNADALYKPATGHYEDRQTGEDLGPDPVHFSVNAGAFFDPLTAVMLCVVCGIGFFITVFAAGYMKGEEGYFRFFAYLGLFIFAMTCLVMGNNLVMLYLGWEGVGLCSYLLIGYYYDKPAAREAAKKAFLVNRVGDFGFGLGIMLTFLVFGTVSYYGDGPGTFTGYLELAGTGTVFGPNPYLASLPVWKQQAAQWIPFLLMVGAFGKSAQFPLYVWLPDAMEGPTPVSALIHAATMVTAGVYMIARNYTLFVQSEAAMMVVTFVGLFTALFAATIALRQFDLKKVFAYSTVSQLGFMFVAVGLLAPVAGVFHLITHAFFKALLFLSSGVVMHAMMGELDLRKMSGLKRVLPKTRLLMLAGCAALAGFPVITSGFWSKDEIVVAAFAKHTTAGNVVGGLLLLTAFLTAYYTFRLYFRVFEGPEVIPASPPGGHGHGASHGHDAHGHDAHGHAAGGHAAGGHAAAHDHGHASASAVHTGTPGESGVDEHLKADTAAHPDPVHATGGHGHGGHGHGGHGHGHHNHEPAIMMVPLYVLAFGALLAGFINTPWWHGLGEFLGQSPSFAGGYHTAARAYGDVEAIQFGQHSAEHEIHWGWMALSGAIALAGIFMAYLLHLKDRRQADVLAARFRGAVRMLEAKYWVDEIYQALIVEPLRALGRVFYAVDRFVVDGLVWLVGFVPQFSGFALKLTVQRGYLQGYAAAMLFGIAVILLIVFL